MVIQDSCSSTCGIPWQLVKGHHAAHSILQTITRKAKTWWLMITVSPPVPWVACTGTQTWFQSCLTYPVDRQSSSHPWRRHLTASDGHETSPILLKRGTTKLAETLTWGPVSLAVEWLGHSPPPQSTHVLCISVRSCNSATLKYATVFWLWCMVSAQCGTYHFGHRLNSISMKIFLVDGLDA